MSNETVLRHDRDGDLVERVYRRAERRLHESSKEEGRQRLRDRIGFVGRPPKNFRERCLGVREEETREPTFIDALRERREKRERKERVRHE